MNVRISRISRWVVAPVLCVAGLAFSQEMLMDAAANRVIQKYEMASCDQLWMQKSQPPTPEKERVVQFLRNDPTARTAFINRIAAPIANKMFECGMIP